MCKSWFFRTSTVLALAVVLLSACTPKAVPVEQEIPTTAPENVSASVDEPVIIKLGYLPTGSFNPIFVAQELGYFAEEGLQVQLESFRTGGEMIAPLSLGQIDIGSGEIGTALFNAIQQGMDIRVVSALGALKEGHSYINLLVNKELNDSGEITEVADLAGRKIAVNATRGVTEYLLYKTLSTADLTVDDVEMVVIAFPDMVQAMANQAVDTAYLHYPLAAKALQAGENGEPPIAEILFAGDQIPGLPQASAFYYGKTMLDPANHDTGVCFMKAILKGFRALQGEEWRQNEQIVAAISKYTNVPVASVKKVPINYHEPNGLIDRTGMEDIQAYYVTRGYTDYTELLPLDQVIRDDFRLEALELIGEYK